MNKEAFYVTRNYGEARSRANVLETTAPQVRIYNTMRVEDRVAFFESLRDLPKNSNIKRWRTKDPQKILEKAVRRGVLRDTFPDYLEDRAKRLRPKNYWATQERQHELGHYLEDYDLYANSRIAEFTWIEGKGRYQRIPPAEGYAEIVHLSDGNIIPDKAKEVLPQIRVAYAGAGVGSSLLEGAVRAGVQKVTIADGGYIMYHDQNRLQGPDVATIHTNHAADAAKKAYKANPHIDAICHVKNIGLEDTDSTVSIDTFLKGAGIVFEEIDNLQMKILIRERARELGIPVMMATDVGMGTIIDYQPADYKGDIFPGISREDYERIKRGDQFTIEEITEFAIQIVGPQVNYWRDDVVKKKRPFWSQTGAAADASKAHATATLVKWANGDDIPARQIFLEKERRNKRLINLRKKAKTLWEKASLSKKAA